MNNRFKMIRETLNKSQEEMGEAIGITRSGISNIESGKRSVSERHIKLLRSAYNVNEHWLRTGEGEMFNPASKSLDTLADTNKIDPVTRAIVEGLIEMPAAQREAFIDLIFSISDKIKNGDYEGGQAEAVAASLQFETVKVAAAAQDSQAEVPEDFSEPHTV